MKIKFNMFLHYSERVPDYVFQSECDLLKHPTHYGNGKENVAFTFSLCWFARMAATVQMLLIFAFSFPCIYSDDAVDQFKNIIAET